MKALIIVDMQNDFCPGGALAVADGDTIIQGINLMAASFSIIVTTKDWHPLDHGSFASNHPGAQPYDLGTLSGKEQVLWPDHCVQDSPGAELHRDLKVTGRNFVKGTDRNIDSYSVFFDDNGATTGLDEYLKEQQVDQVYICGLATDYCVKFTALDALKQGYKTIVLEDLCKGVNVTPQDSEKALEELRIAGALILDSTTLGNNQSDVILKSDAG